ncbi:hypothetical protein [Piscibacillus halophilus]|uniref:Transcriptional regulator n=1 Tax=Piscibacillus halophilus TaxID=571933 RepID=A0A1H9FLB6_9BACI|nr:hypothetical protein [Piscibacillus halophilus]SEQ38615.1 hypothetical protein SAMN05216362_11258 [Piscibacillus halophilus]
MKFQIGVIGPNDSIEKINEIGKSFNDLKLVTFPYEKTEETKEILENHKNQFDYWLLSGPVPYKYAIDHNLLGLNDGHFARLHGSSLFGTLLEANIKEGRIIESVSLDSIGEEEIKQVGDSYAIQHIKINIKASNTYIPSSELSDFHQELYESGKTDVALTCVRSVYLELKKRGVPVYRVLQSDLSIYSALSHLRERAFAKQFEKKQFVILGVEILYPKKTDSKSISFKLMRQELDLNRILIDFVEKINGSLVSMGKGLFYIYTTKGEIELFQKYHSPYQLIKEMEAASGLSVQVGIGYGSTVLEANDHVQVAFNYVQKNDEASIVIIDEDKNVIEYNTDNEHLQYQLKSSVSKWKEKLQSGSISASKLSKIESLAYHYQCFEITSSDLANWLNSTERNARRLLAEMERIGVVEVIGEEANGRGRPKKIYKLNV